MLADGTWIRLNAGDGLTSGVSPQVESAAEAEEDHVVAAGRLHLRPLHCQTVSVHPGQTRLPQLR